jgi:alpha-N-arabinofuranosidase
MTPEYYANIYRQYATFLSGWTNDGRIVRVASGANSSDYRWTEVLMREIPSHLMEAVALHHYSVINWDAKSSATGFTEQQYFATMKSALFMEELITRHVQIMDRYDPRKKVALFVDEWGGWYDVEPGTNPGFLFQQNSMRDAMLAGVTLNIFNNHADRVKMANIAQMVNVLQAVILTDKEKIIFTPTYHVMEMYNVHQDARQLPVQVTTTDYTMGQEKLPAVSVSASRDSSGITHITLVNIDAKKAHDVQIDLRGGKLQLTGGRILSSAALQDHNTFQQPEKIRPQPFNTAKMTPTGLQASLPPFSVVVLTLK